MWWRVLLAVGLALAVYVIGGTLFWVSVEGLGSVARAFVSDRWAESFADSLEKLAGVLGAQPAWTRSFITQIAEAVRSYPQLAPLLTFAVPVGLGLARLFYPLIRSLTKGPPSWLSQKGLRGRRPNRTLRLAEAQLLDRLLEFADADPPQATVRAFYGIFGSDETAVEGLALEWLRSLQQRGWQGGIKVGDISDLWETGKRTAVVIHCENTASFRASLRDLSEVLLEKRGAKVRILFCTKTDLLFDPDDPVGDVVWGDAWSTLYRPTGTRSEARSSVARGGSGSVGREGDADQQAGPEAATSLFVHVPARHPRGEAQGLVNRATEAFGVEGVQLLVLCALFDPLPSHVRAELLPQTGDKAKLGSIFQTTWDSLKHALPSLRELRADVLALCLDRLPRSDRERLLARVSDRCSDGVLETLNNLLEEQAINALAAAVEALDEEEARAKTSSPDKLVVLRAAFEAFDANGALRRAFPDHFDELIEDAFDEFISTARGNLRRRIDVWGQSAENAKEAERLQARLALVPASWKNAIPSEGEGRLTRRLGDGRITARRQGALLGRCVQALVPYNPVEAFSLLARRLEAIAPAMLEAMTLDQRRELLLALAAARPVMSLRDDLKLLADANSWLQEPAALRHLLEMLFDWQIARVSGQLPQKVQAAFPEGLTTINAIEPLNPVFDLALQGVVFVGQIPLDPKDYTEDWVERASKAEPMILNLLDSQDQVTANLGAMAVFWLSGANDNRPALAPLSEAVFNRILEIAESSRSPGPTWRRAIDVVTKLAGAPLPEDVIYAWAVAADTGGESPDLQRTLRVDAGRLERTAIEARLRLADPSASPSVRSSAGLFLLTFGVATESAADAVASGVMATTFYQRRDWMLGKLAQAGPVPARRAMLELARGPSGPAAYRAKLALLGIGARDLIHAHLPELDPTGALELRAVADKTLVAASSP
jgi:hypothetical protein